MSLPSTQHPHPEPSLNSLLPLFWAPCGTHSPGPPHPPAAASLLAGSETACLITCERCEGCFGAWGRPFAFHSRLLSGLSREEEARDKVHMARTSQLSSAAALLPSPHRPCSRREFTPPSFTNSSRVTSSHLAPATRLPPPQARTALELPLWTLGDDLDDVIALAGTDRAALVSKLKLKASGQLTAEQLKTQNGMEKRSPQQIAKDRASYVLDLAVAAPEEYSWEGMRGELAELYEQADMASIGAFVSAPAS